MIEGFVEGKDGEGEEGTDIFGDGSEVSRG